ncbi:unnamed protein product [Rhizophagus irregularis]|nr:unnamed protein product [Rhizophagus irregularis]
MFENADKEIPNIPNLYKKNPDAKYTSQVFTFSNLPKPVNSSIVISYLKETNNKENNQADNKIYPDAIYTSRELTFNNLSKPINSSIISSYLQEDKINEATYHDSQLADLDFKRFL